MLSEGHKILVHLIKRALPKMEIKECTAREESIESKGKGGSEGDSLLMVTPLN